MYRDYGYRYFPEASIWADWAMNLEYLSRGKKIAMIPEDTFIYRDHPQQAIKSPPPELYRTSMAKIYDKFAVSGELREQVDNHVNKATRMLKVVGILKKYQLYSFLKSIKDKIL